MIDYAVPRSGWFALRGEGWQCVSNSGVHKLQLPPGRAHAPIADKYNEYALALSPPRRLTNVRFLRSGLDALLMRRQTGSVLWYSFP